MITSRMRQGIAACRGIRDVFSEGDFLLIFDDAIICQSTQNGREDTQRLRLQRSNSARVEGNFLLLKQAIKCCTRIARRPWSGGFARREDIAMSIGWALSITGPHRGRSFGRDIAGDGDARGEQLTRVGLVLKGDAYWYWLGALKASGRFKVYALLATVQCRVTLRARSFEVYVRGQRNGAIKTARGDYILNKARKLWPRYI